MAARKKNTKREKILFVSWKLATVQTASNSPMHIYGMENYSGIRKNQLSTQTTTRMDSKGVMLNETTASLSRSYMVQYHLGSTLKMAKLQNGGVA